MRFATALPMLLLMVAGSTVAHASKGSPHTPSAHSASTHTATPHTTAAHTSALHTPTVHTPEPHAPVGIKGPFGPKNPLPPSPPPPVKEPRPGPGNAPQPGRLPIAHLPSVPAIHPSVPMFIAHGATPTIAVPVSSVILVTGTGTGLNGIDEEFAESEATTSAEQAANISCTATFQGTPIGIASNVVSGCTMLSVAPFSCEATATVLCQVTQS